MKGRVTQGQRTICWFTSQITAIAGAPDQSNAPGTQSRLPTWGTRAQAPGDFLLCLPRHINRELGWKWNSNQHSSTRCWHPKLWFILLYRCQPFTFRYFSTVFSGSTFSNDLRLDGKMKTELTVINKPQHFINFCYVGKRN